MIKLLIVEDNLMIANLVEDILVMEGYQVCGIAGTVSEAVAMCRSQHPQYAIVDLHLADERPGTALRSQLEPPAALGILFASDNASGISLTARDGIAFIAKPFRPQDLLRALAIVIDISNAGSSLLAHPPGFRLLEPPAS